LLISESRSYESEPVFDEFLVARERRADEDGDRQAA